MKAILISSIASNQGKTLFTTALLNHYKTSVRPFKIGPDFIDPQFHHAICNTNSINLDSFIMNKNQVKWIFDNYSDKDISILEGVMGFYDGMDKGCSSYDIGKLLNIPSILLLDASGSYITISAVLKGLKTYRDDNTIKAVVLNKVSSNMHFELIKNQILKDFDDIEVLGWIKKDLKSLEHTHLGLDLAQKNDKELKDLTIEVLENIDLERLEKLANYKRENINEYPFSDFKKVDKKVSIVYDENFSFLYYDNLVFLKELFSKVELVNPTKDETISNDTHLVLIPGGYVETEKSYNKIKDSNNFKNSLINHANKNKHIYAECAGLLYLAKCVDDKKMSGILDVEFTLTPKRVRLGYYYSQTGLKGHAFHYTKPLDTKNAIDILSKKENSKGELGAWRKNNVYGTYLHTMFRNNIKILKDYFGI
ncbi:cobyrinate a,c-diamide synthase [Halarcobacter ebronensis]|uniref:Cobyrinate a,c-diamide synthase n=1 Tax=Halarcobacter ebronensis TaxID=1462615 RepID=A0A4Q1AHX4_9BACT|nr:cobyrinate a,c-diamide synthase [Halarcobacter ebronensis]QKF82153.1 cobyrinic acid a,c-diamide synthase [Halarcobacter ebronensis]RXK03468.1 cobyrinate a,c-diamide synthase [Halarcobacter ebronensis]